MKETITLRELLLNSGKLRRCKKIQYVLSCPKKICINLDSTELAKKNKYRINPNAKIIKTITHRVIN